MGNRSWTTATIALASLAITLATASVGFCRNVLLDSGKVGQTGVLVGGGGGGGGGQDPGPDDPFSKPRKPGQPVLDSQTANSISFHWTDNSSYETGYNLYRGPSYSGPWTRIAMWGPASGTMSYTDNGLPRDTRYYYQVGAVNAYGESFSAPQTFATIDGRGVSRAQLRVRTANVEDAGTDDSVHASLKDNNGTWLDYGRDDRERGDEFTYELLLTDLSTGIRDLSDINDIYLFKTGSDGWCIESLALLIDGVEIYNQYFGATSSTCRWLDNENGHENYYVVGRDMLRAHPLWQTYQQPIPSTRLLRTDLVDRIEGIVGDIIHEDIWVDSAVYMGTVDPYWGTLHDGYAVQVSKKDNQAVHVSFNLGVDIPGPDLDVDLAFDLRFTGVCRTNTAPAKILMTMENVHASADFSWVTEALTLWLINFAEDDIAANIEQSFPKFDQTIVIDNKVVSCVTPSVDDAGSVFFDVAFAPRTGGTSPLPGGGRGGVLSKNAGLVFVK